MASPQVRSTIVRTPLSQQVRTVLLERMRSGDVPWGEPINEVKLADELGVSRTPLREALISLAATGHVANRDSQGFAYPQRNTDDLLAVAPVIAELEFLAVRLTDADDRKDLGQQLLTLAEEFAADSATHETLMVKDDEWHRLMISRCANTFLTSEIEAIRQQLHRYESLIVPTSATVTRVADEHRSIARNLRTDDVEAAGTALRLNWLNGVTRLLSVVS